MTADEKQKMLAWLEQGRDALKAAVDGVSEEEAARVPAPGRWSVLECVEHIAIVEDYLYGQIVVSTAVAEPVINALRESLIPVRGLDRTRRIECPAEGLPAGRFKTLAAAIAHFLESRERTIALVAANREDLRARITTHPLLGTVNCYETLMMIAVHPLRHVGQIEEIEAAHSPGAEVCTLRSEPSGLPLTDVDLVRQTRYT